MRWQFVANFYDNLKSVASKLLQDKGQQLTFTRAGSAAFDPVTGGNTKSESTYTGYGAAFDYNKAEIDGVVVQRGDIRLILEATATEPENDDTVSIDSESYRVMNVKKTSPAGTVVAYELQLRK